ncbi:hypothetical protein HDU98_003300 [Podochytrium sp. JEL0797]|nr:hypothetical protein HDU98_003300 [Podochytrium sp. JEL0797]
MITPNTEPNKSRISAASKNHQAVKGDMTDAKEGMLALFGDKDEYEYVEHVEHSKKDKKSERLINQIVSKNGVKDGVSVLLGDNDADYSDPPSQQHRHEEPVRKKTISSQAKFMKEVITGGVRDGVEALFGHDEEAE